MNENESPGEGERDQGEREEDRHESKRSGRWTRRLLWALVLVEFLWLAAGNAFLRTSWGPELLARRPEKLQITWQSGWTPLPGVVRVHRIDVRGRTPKVTWMASADAAWLWIAPLDLLRRRFHVRWLDADALESRVRLEKKDLESQPGIDGFEGLPEPERKQKKHRWRLDFDRVSVDGIRELWFGPLRYVARPEGPDDGLLVGTARGKLRSRVGGEVSVPWAEVELGPGRAIAGSEVIGAVTRLAFDGSLDPFVPQEVKGIATLHYVSGTFEAATTGGSLGLVDYFFRGAPASVHGTGRLDTVLHLDHGVLQPKSELAVDNGSVEVSYLGWHGEGDGRLTGEVAEGGETTLSVTLDEAEFGLSRVAENLVVSRNAKLVATADRFDLSVRRPALQVTAELPESKIADLAQLQAFLPAHAKVEILGGSGRLSGRGVLTTIGTEPGTKPAERPAKDGESASDQNATDQGAAGRDEGDENAGGGNGPGIAGTISGSLQIRGDAVDVRVQGRDIAADVDLAVEVPSGDLVTRRLEVGGSRLQLRNVRVKGTENGGPWWADLKLPKGVVQMPREGSVINSAVDAEIRADLADSRPILALVIEKRESFRWFEKLLTFENLDLVGSLRTRNDGVELRDLRVHDRASEEADKDLQILGQVRFGEAGYDALLRASMKAPVGHLAAGLLVHDGKIQDIDLYRSLDWYRKRSGGFWAVD